MYPSTWLLVTRWYGNPTCIPWPNSHTLQEKFCYLPFLCLFIGRPKKTTWRHSSVWNGWRGCFCWCLHPRFSNLFNLCTGTPIKETWSALDVQSHFLVQVTVLLHPLTLYPSCLLCSGAPTYQGDILLHNEIHPIVVTTSCLFRVGMIILSQKCFVSSHQMTCVFSVRSGIHSPVSKLPESQFGHIYYHANPHFGSLASVFS